MSSSKPSFLRSLFSGEIEDELLFPYPAPLDERNPDEAALVRRLVASLHAMVSSGLIDSRRFDEEETLPEDVIRAFASAGLLGITIPKAYGGAGLSNSGYARVFGAVAAVDPSLAVLIGVHCGLGGKAIVLFGNDEQKARYLPPLARGETMGAYALTEPETGSDAQNIVTEARRAPDGKGWILNGRKHWIGSGHRAGVIVTFAQTPVVRDGERTTRPTAFIVRPDMPGFRVEGTVRKLGIRGSTQAELAFEELYVPDDHVLGEVGKGFRVAVHALNAGRLSLAAGCTAAAKRLLGEMTRYGEARTQFGGPLASFEITQRKMATLAADTYAADCMVGSLAGALDDDRADAALEAACVKVFASELVWRAADDMVQLAGGRGFVKPWPYERYLRDARINRIFEGANEILRLFVGLNGIQGPAEELKELAAAIRNPVRNWVMVSEYAAERVRSALGKRDRLAHELHESLRANATHAEKHVAELAALTARMITKHRKEILNRQLVVERLADMSMELYARFTTIARTQRLIETRGAGQCAREIALADLFCVASGRRFRALRLELEGDAGELLDDLRRTVAGRVRAEQGYASDDALLDTELPPLPAWGLMRPEQEASLAQPARVTEQPAGASPVA